MNQGMGQESHCCSGGGLNSSSGGELKLYLKWKRNTPTNAILSFYDCRLSGGVTQTLPAVIKNLFELFALTGGEGQGMQKHLTHILVPEPPG